MIAVKKEGIVLKKTALSFEKRGCIKSSCHLRGGFIHLFYRAVHEGNYSSIGYCKLSGSFYDRKTIRYAVAFSRI